jgi:hypothetical protein
MRNKITFYTALILLVCFVTLPLQAFAIGIDQAFDPNKLIDDKVFANIKTFGGAAGIQKFLESKNSVLANTSPEFLARLKEPTISSLKTALDDPQPNLPRLRTAAELIWDASQSSRWTLLWGLLVRTQVVVVRIPCSRVFTISYSVIWTQVVIGT